MAIWKRMMALFLCLLLVGPMGACGKKKAADEIEVEVVTERKRFRRFPRLRRKNR